MVQIKNLYLKYTREFFALYDVNMSIAEGESVAFVGEDESGKTSLVYPSPLQTFQTPRC